MSESRQPADSFRQLLIKIRLKDVMITKVVTIQVDEPFSRVDELFRLYNIRHLPVVGQKNFLLGIVTQLDLYRVQAPRKDEEGNWFYNQESLDEHILKNVMTRNPLCLRPEDNLADALLIMVNKKFGCIPVTKDGVLCGIITQMDMLKIAVQLMRG